MDEFLKDQGIELEEGEYLELRGEACENLAQFIQDLREAAVKEKLADKIAIQNISVPEVVDREEEIKSDEGEKELPPETSAVKGQKADQPTAMPKWINDYGGRPEAMRKRFMTILNNIKKSKDWPDTPTKFPGHNHFALAHGFAFYSDNDDIQKDKLTRDKLSKDEIDEAISTLSVSDLEIIKHIIDNEINITLRDPKPERSKIRIAEILTAKKQQL